MSSESQAPQISLKCYVRHLVGSMSSLRPNNKSNCIEIISN